MTDPRFVQSEQHYDRLRAELTAGRITADAFERALWDAMFQADGRYWMLGANSRRWYASTGDSWVKASPPLTAGPPGPVVTQRPKPSAPQRMLAVVILIGVAAFVVFCLVSGIDAWTEGDRIGGGIAIGFGLMVLGAIVSGFAVRTRH